MLLLHTSDWHKYPFVDIWEESKYNQSIRSVRFSLKVEIAYAVAATSKNGIFRCYSTLLVTLLFSVWRYIYGENDSC